MAEVFTEAALGKPIRDLGLTIAGTPLESIVEALMQEVVAAGIRRLRPRFYLSTEWGVPQDTIAVAMPFYLAHPELTELHVSRTGHVEGLDAADILRYLRHEMGHAVNYAYRLYATEEWTRIFGPMSRPYVEQYRVIPFSTDFVRHLPGGYAQKHPDEDWAETFAVWMTPGSQWRELYVDSPGALRKLEYCDRMMAEVNARDPDVTTAEIDYDAKEIRTTVQEYYEQIRIADARIPRSLDGDLQVIFARRAAAAPEGRLGDAATLLKRQQVPLANSVYRWTGVDPDLVRQLLAHLIGRAAALNLTYPLAERDEILVELSGFLSTLAMNYIYTGRFIAS